jgi:precorrin-6Y C5,15-methyltransferase (decarboxylating)
VITVVGIGADGLQGLSAAARAALDAAEVVVGSERQLALLPAETRHRRWPSPIGPLVDEIVAHPARRWCVLASGDPMLYGIGATLAGRVDPEHLRIHPHPSAFALACARLRWAAADVELVSAVGRPVDAVARLLQPGRRIVVYVAGADGAARVAGLLRDRGHGPSRLVVLERLGGAEERVTDSTADTWGDRTADPLHAVAVECRPEPGAPLLPLVPGLPDDAYATDGQLTKRHVRAVTLAGLAPLPGRLLWDVGAGSGSIAIEWLRAEPTARAIAIEADAVRAERVRANAARLGVPGLDVRLGRAPGALAGLHTPDAIFVGGGLTTPAMFERCWAALRPGGRIVSNAVTVEGEQVLLTAHATYGGTLLRLELSESEPIGRYTGWRPQRPVVQWSATKADG